MVSLRQPKRQSSLEQQNKEEGTQPQEHNRPERKLGRGLEDVSHLFLSQGSGYTSGDQRTSAPLTEQIHQHGSAIPAILRPSTAVNREMLISLLHKNTAALEEGLRAIDTNIPCNSLGMVDILASDKLNQLVIIDVDTTSSDRLLLRGICQFDWFDRNVPILRRMYHGRVIDFSSQPRLLLAAPGFSPLLLGATRRFNPPQISCYRYHTVEITSRAAILFERVLPT